MNNSFALDKSNARLMGVCAGISNWTGMDLFLVRFGMVVASLLLTPMLVLLYLILGFTAPQH